jgi:hypothetical protein
MQLHRRPLIVLIAVAAFAVTLAATSVALGSTVAPKPAAVTVKAPASVGVLACKSGRYAADRSVGFRVKISKQSLLAPGAPEPEQKLEMRVEVYRQLLEGSRYRKLKIDGLGEWKAAENPAATAYQRDYILNGVDTAANYRAKAFFRWSYPSTGVVVNRRTVWSKTCKQKVSLPFLRITLASAVPITGSTDLLHTITVANTGGSEAEDVPVAINVDAKPPVVKTVSLAPKATTDIQFQAPACELGAYAILDPLRTISRLQAGTRDRFYLQRCR